MEQKYICMNCKAQFDDRGALTWISDNYGIPFQLVCDDCYDEVEEYIRNHNYGKYLSQYELYGDEY